MGVGSGSHPLRDAVCPVDGHVESLGRRVLWCCCWLLCVDPVAHHLIVTKCRSDGRIVGMQCSVCGGPISWSGRGRRPMVCGVRCRKRRSRARALPTALTDLPRWTRADCKRPIRCDGSAASSTNASTWTTYADVCSSSAGDGLGIMLGDGLACWDLDHVLSADGVLADEAQRVLDEVGERALWVERSVSGEGLHVFVEGAGRSYQGERISYYSRARFIRVTGDPYQVRVVA